MIYCKKCGKALSDDSLFCTSCGTKVDLEPPKEAEKVVQRSVRVTPVSVQITSATAGNPGTEIQTKETHPVPVRKEQKPADPPGTPSEIVVFVLGIVSIVLSTTGIPGLILSLITLSKVRAREQAIGELTGKSRIGKTLATVALPVSIVFIVIIGIRSILSVVKGIEGLGKLAEIFDKFLKQMTP